MTVVNGKRVAFVHASSRGRAGIITANGKTTMAYFAKSSGALPELGTELTVDGDLYTVTTTRLFGRPRIARIGLEPVV